MGNKPHLPTYIAAISFLTIVLFFVVYVLSTTSTEAAIIGVVVFIISFSTIYVVAASLLIQNWMSYINSDNDETTSEPNNALSDSNLEKDDK